MLIEIFSDIVCPWCYIGRHRLNTALAERPRLTAERRWQPFQLNPSMPEGGMDRTLYLAARFGSLERARQILAVVEETAEREGLGMAVDRIRRTPNTLDAHRLIRLAQRQGVADAIVDSLFAAYFVEGLDIGDRDVLCARAFAAGMDADAVRAHLEGDADAAAVRTGDALARQLGLHAVPCFVFNRRYAISGAQEPLVFLPLLDLTEDEGAREDHPLPSGERMGTG